MNSPLIVIAGVLAIVVLMLIALMIGRPPASVRIWKDTLSLATFAAGFLGLATVAASVFVGLHEINETRRIEQERIKENRRVEQERRTAEAARIARAIGVEMRIKQQALYRLSRVKCPGNPLQSLPNTRRLAQMRTIYQEHVKNIGRLHTITIGNIVGFYAYSETAAAYFPLEVAGQRQNCANRYFLEWACIAHRLFRRAIADIDRLPAGSAGERLRTGGRLMASIAECEKIKPGKK